MCVTNAMWCTTGKDSADTTAMVDCLILSWVRCINVIGGFCFSNNTEVHIFCFSWSSIGAPCVVSHCKCVVCLQATSMDSKYESVQ